MITETQPRIIVLQITDELLARLHPYMAGLGISLTPQSAWAEHEVDSHGQSAGQTRGVRHYLQLTMRAEFYQALVERVGDALDYDVRWQPNEYEPDGFVERVRPLELTNGILVASGCPQCEAQLLANRVEVVCACGQAVALI